MNDLVIHEKAGMHLCMSAFLLTYDPIHYFRAGA